MCGCQTPVGHPSAASELVRRPGSAYPDNVGPFGGVFGRRFFFAGVRPRGVSRTAASLVVRDIALNA